VVELPIRKATVIDQLMQPVVDWAVRPGPANWLFVVVLLTYPAMWSTRLRKLVRSRWGAGGSDGAVQADGEGSTSSQG